MSNAMLVIQDPEFNTSFPENFNWSLIDSPSLSPLACTIAARIIQELQFPPPERHFIGGLRCALVEIAKIAKI